MMGKYSPVNNQHGSVLNVALLFLILITLIVIFLSRSSTTDVKIATNVKMEKARFYEADEGVDAGSEIVEQNFNCPLGFSANYPAGTMVDRKIGDILIPNSALGLKYNTVPLPATTASYHARWPASEAVGADNTTYVFTGGQGFMSDGSAIDQHSGYESMGQALAKGGVNYQMQIQSRRIGKNSIENDVWIRWRHLVGMEDPCQYY